MNFLCLNTEFKELQAVLVKRKEGQMSAAIKSIQRAGEILYFPTAALHQGKPQNSSAAAP